MNKEIYDTLIEYFKFKLSKTTKLSEIERNSERYFLAVVQGPPEDAIFIEENVIQKHRKTISYSIKCKSLGAVLSIASLSELENLVNDKIAEIQSRNESDDIRRLKEMMSSKQ